MTSPGPVGGTPVKKRIERSITGGCLVFLVLLIMVGVSLVTVVGYVLWSTGNTTEKNRTAAEAELHDLINRAALESAGALRASAATDPATLTALIGKHTEAPVITYDAAHKKFTAVVEKATDYQRVNMLGGGSDRIAACGIFTYTLGPDRTWRVDVTTRETTACLPSSEVGHLARGAREVLEGLDDDLTTVTQARRALDRTRPLGRLTVRKVTHDKRTTTISALLTDTAQTVDQCFLLTLPRPGNQVPSPVTVTPASSC
ncbi:hypothetical protein [Streptomyces nymphaeiformis]|uniref:Flagellar basal body-associated protein FliL n=1 Tax=Streptomyces nymphaeiformis TaxID=2663842 RepID=A0A7W7U8S1_9ACTN|nr:hypothetical protein [Streptomyces nymphaeiformis]MBB4987142.1 flagellar basal body-associated protein FliL [Streptomyces nymphaeiformis]